MGVWTTQGACGISGNMKITEHTIDIKKLRENPDNPRTINDAQFNKLKDSVRQAPWMLSVRPLVVDEGLTVLGGNMRLRALLSTGVATVRVLKLEDATDDEKREFVVKDNLAYGEWDFETLRNDWDLPQLAEWGLEIPAVKIEIENDEEDEINDATDVETEIVRGDVISIGEHVLICGDSFDTHVVDAITRFKPDFIFSDPMYDENAEKIESLFIATAVPHILVMCTFSQAVCFFRDSVYKVNFDLIWDQKTPASMLNKKVPYYVHKNIVYASMNGESIFHCDNAKGYFSEKGYFPSIIDAPKNTRDIHGLTKNSEALTKMLSGFAFKKVFDPFIGSGSTMIAAHNLGKICYGIEINPKYCQIVVDRMKKLFTGIEITVNGVKYEK